MPKINLLNKRKGITIDEFKSWLNDLVTNKKGALPDLHDWKEIKEMLDKVRVGSYDEDDDRSGYVILDGINVNDLDTSYLEDLRYFTERAERMSAIPKDYMRVAAYCQRYTSAEEADMPITEMYVNGVRVTLDNNYGKTKENGCDCNSEHTCGT